MCVRVCVCMCVCVCVFVRVYSNIAKGMCDGAQSTTVPTR